MDYTIASESTHVIRLPVYQQHASKLKQLYRDGGKRFFSKVKAHSATMNFSR